jgi:hypothetical protein
VDRYANRKTQRPDRAGFIASRPACLEDPHFLPN